LAYVGSCEDRKMGLAYFTRLSWLFLEIGVSVSGPVTIEEMKRVLYPLKMRAGTYSKVVFLVLGILRKVAETRQF
jgi:hypothetical protein